MEVTMDLDITLSFTPEDLAWIQQNNVAVPEFWKGHLMQPERGDLVRFGERQWVVVARVWEHSGQRPMLRLYMSGSAPPSDPTLH